MKKLSVFSLIVSFLFIFSCEDKVEKDTTPPLLTIVFPTSGSTVGEVVKIKVETSDDSGILKVDFYVPNTKVVSDTTSPYEYDWNTTSNEDGDYNIKVISYETIYRVKMSWGMSVSGFYIY
ncbi:MAG: Ig-like domain-containing protein [Candidatus Marinimicrobia bacterium]|nr:Ig-like domain-containing protein [Candidatus Neomarinimicrobiota bacterium]